MVFSSIPFVFFFLPLCLILYYGTSFLPCPGRRLDVQTPSERGKFPVQEQAARGRSRRSPAYGRSCFHGEGAIALKNAILLVFSLVFYAWGEPVYVLLMLFSTVVDYERAFGNIVSYAEYRASHRYQFFYLPDHELYY